MSDNPFSLSMTMTILHGLQKTGDALRLIANSADLGVTPAQFAASALRLADPEGDLEVYGKVADALSMSEMRAVAVGPHAGKIVSAMRLTEGRARVNLGPDGLFVADFWCVHSFADALKGRDELAGGLEEPTVPWNRTTWGASSRDTYRRRLNGDPTTEHEAP